MVLTKLCLPFDYLATLTKVSFFKRSSILLLKGREIFSKIVKCFHLVFCMNFATLSLCC